MGMRPRAAGTRIGYADIPDRVRAWVEQTLVAHRTVSDDTGPPGLNEFRTLESARFLAGARRRLGT
jgi:hypothetical protein